MRSPLSCGSDPCDHHRASIPASSTDKPSRPAKPLPIVLGQTLIKGDKMDWVIQKATELGVAAIVPIHSTHSVIKPNPERLEHQRSRWERIARDAAQQSERWTIPTIADPIDLAGICTSICLSTSEEHTRGTLQRPFARHRPVTARLSASDCLVSGAGRGMGG